MDIATTHLTRSPYDILKVNRWVTDEVIKQQYFHLVKQYNPEYFPDEFIEIRTAYDVLKDYSTRAATDIELFSPAPPFSFSDYPEYPHQTLSLFKLNQEMKTLRGDTPLDQLTGEVRAQALHLLRGIGLYYVSHNQFPEAVEAWRQVLAYAPDDEETRRNISYVYWNEGYERALEGDFAKAQEIFSQLVDSGLHHGAVYQNLALCLEKQGNKDAALEAWGQVLDYYKKQLKNDPANEYLKALVLAIHKYTGGKFLKDSKTVSDDSEYVSARSAKELGYACIKNGNWKQAAEALERALNEDKNDIDVLCQLGWAYLNTNQQAKAFHMWNSALKKAPGRRQVIDHLVRGYTIFGKRLKEQRIFNQALVQFKNALKYEPMNVELRTLLADTYYQMRNYPSAIQEYQRILEIEPRNKEARQGIREAKRLGGLR
ncbi:MAG TPA: tetratricopeptide repeat protein [bacterium]|nr:tetratricopeptide repeat protein [Candidatus Omnitrophota bacterium]HOJ60003.1 tetratricopeptide repeat protein [bacterium]HOL93740.1 tetratricopeptide repeat protein [bacterium]HPP01261.1 tetratricopeptide repeat protein [bacterium]HXK95385.1 tetratricopeptide repeat protein [bacterium]